MFPRLRGVGSFDFMPRRTSPRASSRELADAFLPGHGSHGASPAPAALGLKNPPCRGPSSASGTHRDGITLGFLLDAGQARSRDQLCDYVVDTDPNFILSSLVSPHPDEHVLMLRVAVGPERGDTRKVPA